MILKKGKFSIGMLNNKSLNLNTIIHQSNKFTYSNDDDDEKTFVTEASDLGKAFIFGQIYTDACDIGFWMEFVKTGDRMLFYYDKTDLDGEETAGWWFKSDEGYKALIIND
jgi:hypothetical protein